MRFSPKRVALVLAIAGALSLATFAYTNTNTVAPSAAGSGSGAISGYTITDVHYDLGGDPSTIDAVTFTMAPTPAAAATVTIRLTDTGPWYECTMSDASATCVTTGGATVLDADNLTVVAAD